MRHPHSMLGQWKKENKVTPASATVMQAILHIGNGLPIRMLSEYMDCLEDALISGYVINVEDKIYLTTKANQLFQTLVMLAKQDGEL